MADVYSIVILVVGILGLGVILWAVKTGHADRHAEDDARAFYEEHGRWPDQTPEEAAAERERMRTQAGVPDAEPDDEGRV